MVIITKVLVLEEYTASTVYASYFLWTDFDAYHFYGSIGLICNKKIYSRPTKNNNHIILRLNLPLLDYITYLLKVKLCLYLEK